MAKLPLRAAVLALLLAACTPAAPPAPYRTVTLEQIAAGLPAAPIAVGFDVDDTLLFSSPAFYYALHNTEGQDGTNRYGDRPLRNPRFWTDLNAGLDRFSLPKRAARDALEMHKRRGDRIYFITARPATEGERLSDLLRRTFDVDAPPVIFVGTASKAGPLAEHGIALFYGDSDGDMRAAREAGVRAVRFLRSSLSTNPRPPHPGRFGEEVLAGSER